MAKPKYKSQRRPSAPSIAKRPRASANGQARPRENSKPPPEPLPERMVWKGARLAERTSMVLETEATADYALLDSGAGRKLERYGDVIVDRPEGQALWLPALPQSTWDQADAIFTGNTEEEGAGRWKFPKGNRGETWPLAFDGVGFHGRFTSFRHVGVFPEQAAHWHAMQTAIRAAKRPVKMLNLFGYTGVASLVGARAGAEVTHVDASKKAIQWARENQLEGGLQDAPIRWICEDAVKFCAREVRRGNTYDIILLDPPAFGRGPKGEVWQFFEHVPLMLDLVRQLQAEKPIMTVLTSYAIRASSFALHELMQEVFAGMAGRIETGELILRQEGGERMLSTSMFSRHIGEGVDV
ncbi:class I SAM-dependent methyltransferase [Pseudahrensia aquimaris]|uniref:Class I SAM-dependent methyltransferase n=1 Tax=Pseudahrensia aquimaris TaxID=744461 RepID=A0ABW3FIN8_9HYPH